MIFIAEIGMNHNGNMGLIFELVKQASLSGAILQNFAKVGDVEKVKSIN